MKSSSYDGVSECRQSGVSYSRRDASPETFVVVSVCHVELSCQHYIPVIIVTVVQKLLRGV